MNRPEVICHMVSTIDGKIAGQSFAEEGLRPYLEFYVQTKQKFETQATVYGASTAKEIFVGKDMEAFARPSQITDDPDYICGQHAPYFVVAIDPLGRTEDRGSRTQESSSLPLLKRQRNI